MNLTYKKIKPLLKKEWYVEHGDARPFFLSGFNRSFVHRLILRPYSLLLTYYKNGELYWATLVKDQKALFKKILQAHQKDKKFWRDTFRKWLRLKKDLEKTFQELKDKNIRKVGLEEIISDVNRYVDCQLTTRYISSAIDAFAFGAEEELYLLLLRWAQRNKNKINIHQTFEILTRPEDSSFLNEVEVELIKICQLILKNKKLKLLFSKKRKPGAKNIRSFTQIDGLIRAHLEKYAWIKIISFYGGREYNYRDVLVSIKKLLKTDLDEKLRKNKGYLKKRKEKHQFIAKHHFNQPILDIVSLNTLFVKWQDLRKENTLMASFLHLKYLKELSRRGKISIDYLSYLDYIELPMFLEGRINLFSLKKRKTGVLWGLKGSELKIFNQEESKKILKIILPVPKRVKEFKGRVASVGYVRGQVKVVRKIDDVKKIRQGEIIVTSMTRPEHMSAVRKVSAIITDDGGITCHAAIVARELGIPCIISTKIATKVLKDGDMVEVDADKGVVKILKKK